MDGVSTVFHWNGSVWRPQGGTSLGFKDIWGADANNIWAVAGGGAILQRHVHPLQLTSAGSGGGVVRRSPTGNACDNNCVEYGQGVGVSLTATAYSGSTFAGWSGDCSGGGPCLLTIDAAKQVTATFTGHSELVHLPLIAR
jgi:hypothetical protein